MNWKSIRNIEPGALASARTELHYAFQIAAAAPTSLGRPASDWSHTAFRYDPAFRGLLSAPLPSEAGEVYFALRFFPYRISILDSGLELKAEMGPEGSSVQECMDWLRTELKNLGLDGASVDWPEYPDFPDHPLAGGQAFSQDLNQKIEEIDRYYFNSDAALRSISSGIEGASKIRVWPHHFDIATLITIQEPGETGGDDGISVGVGMAPGDPSSRGPYWYVTPWPYPDASRLPKLSAGRWNTDGWVGALLMADELPDDGGGQEQSVHRFAEEAINACRELLTQ